MGILRSVVNPSYLACCLAACGAVGPGNVSGTVGGKSLVLQSTATSNFRAPAKLADLGIEEATVIVLSDSPDVCGDASLQKFLPNKAYLVMVLASLASGSGAQPAVYTAVDASTLTSSNAAHVVNSSSGNLALGQFYVAGVDCSNELPTHEGTVQGGTVTLRNINHDGSGASGSFDLKVGSQSAPLSGNFSGSGCTSLQVFAAAVAAQFQQGGAANLSIGCQ